MENENFDSDAREQGLSDLEDDWNVEDIDMKGINPNWDREAKMPDLKVDDEDGDSPTEKELGLLMKKKLALLPPETALSRYIEEHVGRMMGNTCRPVFVRIVSNVPSVHKLQEPVKGFMKANNMAFEFPYMSKALMCFQERSNGFVAVFAAYFQEYGENCPMPNRNVSYLAYMDSVNLFNPPFKKRVVIFAVLLAYMNYIRHFGFKRMFLWSSPPGEGVEYIFHNRPKTQKSHKDNSGLLKWYHTLRDFALKFKIIKSCSNIETLVKNGKKESGDILIKHIPMCEGDHWPITIEQAIKTFDPDALAPPPAKKMRGKGKGVCTKSPPKDVLSHVQSQINHQFKTDAHSFLSFNLVQGKSSSEVTYEPDTLSSPFIDTRDSFTNFLKKNTLEFETEEKAKTSTMAVLKKLHDERRTNSVQVINGTGLSGLRKPRQRARRRRRRRAGRV